MHQLSIHEDAERLLTKACKKKWPLMLNDDRMSFRLAYRKLISAHSCWEREMREGRERASFGYKLAIRKNPESPDERIPVDVDARGLLAADLNRKSHLDFLTAWMAGALRAQQHEQQQSRR